MRVIHAVRELNEERSVGIRLIVLHTHQERQAMFVREADEAVLIGGATAAGEARNNPYLDHAELRRALAQARADAVWAGWGLVAEDPGFVDLCQRLGIVFVGPDGDVMRRVGNRIAARLLAEQANVPVAPWSRGPVETVDDALLHGRRIGYPLTINAAAGSAGQASRVVMDEAHLKDAFTGARAEAGKSVGDQLDLEGMGAADVPLHEHARGADRLSGLGGAGVQQPRLPGVPVAVRPLGVPRQRRGDRRRPRRRDWSERGECCPLDRARIPLPAEFPPVRPRRCPGDR